MSAGLPTQHLSVSAAEGPRDTVSLVLKNTLILKFIVFTSEDSGKVKTK
jgi:hypothetical protein